MCKEARYVCAVYLEYIYMRSSSVRAVRLYHPFNVVSCLLSTDQNSRWLSIVYGCRGRLLSIANSLISLSRERQILIGGLRRCYNVTVAPPPVGHGARSHSVWRKQTIQSIFEVIVAEHGIYTSLLHFNCGMYIIHATSVVRNMSPIKINQPCGFVSL